VILALIGNSCSLIPAAKRANSQAYATAWEPEINKRVYQLCGLARDEIELVEEGVPR
jgi:hypothetical protein